MNSIQPLTDSLTYEKEVIRIFAEVTRYPEELLDTNADLEDDLGIDSIKLAEVFAVLRSTYRLPGHDALSIPREALTSIGGIIKFLMPYAEKLQSISKVQAAGTPIERLRQVLDSMERDEPLFSDSNILQPRKSTIPIPDIQKEVIAVFAEITRYPVEMLDVNAHLEEDLGIDSVKLGEIFATLRAKYNLPVAQDMTLRSDALTSIAGITEALTPYIIRQGVEDIKPEQKQTKVTRPIAGMANPESDAAFIEEFMQHVSVMLNIPLQLLRPDDYLEADLSFDAHKLKNALKNLDAKYELRPDSLEQWAMSFKTLRDIASAIVKIKSLA